MIPVSPLRVHPGRAWRTARALAQALAWVALLVGPLLGGWQRNDAGALSAWHSPGWDLPEPVAQRLGPTETGERLHEANPLQGGGTGVEYVGIPMLDPVVGAAAIVRTQTSPKVWLALLLPLFAALVLGRVFCGWFCPFGSLSRGMAAVLLRVPGLGRRYPLGPRRPLRWLLLIFALTTSALGSQLVVTLALPHLVLKQSLYSLWLGGGGGAVLGWLLGLLVVGVGVGPTAYCASLCPTGALLGLLGRLRPARLRIEDPEACGVHCHSCDLGCWLSLHPSHGDAGGDCDNCGRCLEVCPQDNLRVGYRRGRLKKSLPIVAAGLLVTLGAPPAAAQTTRVRPALVLDAHQEVEGVSIAVGVLDLSTVRLDADAKEHVGGVEVSVRLTRGPRSADDERGRQGSREHLDGPLLVELARGDEVLATLEWARPNSPRSTVNRKVYTDRRPVSLRPGDEVRIPPVSGWTMQSAVFVVPEPQAGADRGFLPFLLVGALVQGGLLLLAIALSTRERPVRVST